VLSKNKYVHMSTCMLALLFCVLAARPFAPVGINDDWSYIWTARVLADTGHIAYNGWSAMVLGWQVYLGALSIKLFGFSFTIVRSSVMVVSLLCAALIQRVFARLGASEWTASIATLSLVLSPLFLPLSFSFMTDIPALFILVLCIYCCIRAFESVSDKQALYWLALAALSNVVGGTVRQTTWLGALLVVPSAAWCMRRRRHLLLAGVGLWVVSSLSIALCMHWFSVQPGAINERVFYEHPAGLFHSIGPLRDTLVFLLPVMSAFLVTHRPGKRLTHNFAAISGAIAGAIIWWATKTHLKNFPFGGSGNYLTRTGVSLTSILGDEPEVVPAVVRFLLTVFIFSAFASFVVFLIGRRGTSPHDQARKVSGSEQYPYVSNASLFALLAPFTAVYALLVLIRQTDFDRYSLSLIFVVTIGLIRVYTQDVSDSLPRICFIVGLVYAAFGVTSTHDLFAFQRARVNAANEITATGVQRTEIQGGFEYDGWTQLEEAGYINNPRIVNPSDAYHPWTAPAVPLSCIGWFAQYSPSVRPLFHLSNTPDSCERQSRFAPVEYETWLPPRRRTIYILGNR
jgi:hypothetical protein